ncbi:MAG: radical SAM protein [Thermodesulfovibrionales bacterium]|jgi:hypothetical protein
MLPFDKTGLSYTKKCVFACGHCIAESSPLTEGKMSFDEAKGYIKSIAKVAKLVSFTGGEALIYYDEIIKLVGLAKDLGLEVGIVTSSGWVYDDLSNCEKIIGLAEAGLSRLVLSWDQYHEQFSGIEKPLALARAARDLGVDVRIRTVAAASGSDRAMMYYEKFKEIASEHEIMNLLKLGRAAGLPDDSFCWTETLPRGYCSSVGSPVVDVDGTVYACCGPSFYSSKKSPLVLGNAKEEPLENILNRAKKDPVLYAIHVIGPYGLHQLLEHHPEFQNFKKRARYTGTCELCLDITNTPDWTEPLRERLKDRKTMLVLQAIGLQKKTEKKKQLP